MPPLVRPTQQHYGLLDSLLLFLTFVIIQQVPITRIERMYACQGGTTRSPKHRFLNQNKQKACGQTNRKANRQEKSHSSSYRNRSLKQLFGDIPAINEYQSVQGTAKPKQAIKIKPSPVVCLYTNKEAVHDEYLMKRTERQKSNKGHDPESIKSPRQENQYKRNNITRDKPTDSTASTQRAKTESGFYNPKVYCWRKIQSKQKNKQVSQANSKDLLASQAIEGSRQLGLAQSEYYGTPRQSGKRDSAHLKIISMKRMRSSSIELQKAQRHLQLKPRVKKHIFDVKSPRKNKSLTTQQNLLFTFGV